MAASDRQGESLSDVFDNLSKSIARAVLQATLMGNGPLGGMFGMAPPAGGGEGGAIGLILSGIKGTLSSDPSLPGFSGGGLIGFSPTGVVGHGGAVELPL